MCLPVIWDAEACAAEVRRNAERGVHALTFTENPAAMGYPSFHDDYWTPFLGGTGEAPAYLVSVGDDVRERIRLHLKSRLASTPDGPIELTAQAWAVQGLV